MLASAARPGLTISSCLFVLERANSITTKITAYLVKQLYQQYGVIIKALGHTSPLLLVTKSENSSLNIQPL
jgi:hypothetical protein